MKRENWGQVYEPIPPALDLRLAYTLARLEEENPRPRKLTLRTAALVLALLLALGGVAYAVLVSNVADIYGWFYGKEKKESLLSGDRAMTEQSYTLGDVVYTVDEVIYAGGTLYGTGVMRPREGANVVLLASGHSIGEAAGYNLHIGGDEEVPEDAPSYLEVAEERGAKIVTPLCNVLGYEQEDGSLSSSEVGIISLQNADGSIRFTFEFEGTQNKIPRAEAYVIRLKVAHWEVDREGYPLRDDDENTYMGAEWDVRVMPTLKGE